MSVTPACNNSVSRLSAFVDGELPAKERVEVEQHLASCRRCELRVADFRAQGIAVRGTLELASEGVDFSQFSRRVMAGLTPIRPPLMERWQVAAREMFTYQRPALAGGFAVAALAAVVAFGFLLPKRAAEGYAASHVAVNAVSTPEGAHVSPVVMKTEQGTIIWLVDNGPGVVGAPDSGRPVENSKPKGGEL